MSWGDRFGCVWFLLWCVFWCSFRVRVPWRVFGWVFRVRLGLRSRRGWFAVGSIPRHSTGAWSLDCCCCYCYCCSCCVFGWEGSGGDWTLTRYGSWRCNLRGTDRCDSGEGDDWGFLRFNFAGGCSFIRVRAIAVRARCWGIRRVGALSVFPGVIVAGRRYGWWVSPWWSCWRIRLWWVPSGSPLSGSICRLPITTASAIPRHCRRLFIRTQAYPIVSAIG